MSVHVASEAEAPQAARLLHDFNTEFGDPTPGPAVLAKRLEELIGAGEATVLLGGSGPDGVAVFRLRRAIFVGGLDAYLEELYVAPAKRRQGIGRALLDAAMDAARDAGATRMDIATSVDDTAAIGLYESTGFSNREGEPDGPSMIFYERDL